jgi:1,4-alpha-glucan branching enzyme
VSEGISPKVTIGLTPVLCEQLADEKFRLEFLEYLHQKEETAELNRKEFREQKEPELEQLADLWTTYYSSVRERFERAYQSNLIGAFRKLQDDGHIEIITCAATHGYLPLLSQDSCIRAQVQIGVESYRLHFGRDPKGIWLPECAYRPGYAWKSPIDEGSPPVLRKGIEEFLSEVGIRYTFIDSHLLRGGKAIGVYLVRFEGLRKLWEQYEKELGVDAEIKERSPYDVHWIGSGLPHRAPVAIFTRDPETGLQVWSGEHGYPGDGNYLDFHKKKFPGGHRYWKVTSAKADLGDKLQYVLSNVEARVQENAGHFKEMVKGILHQHARNQVPLPIVCAPYDTELFGHWWFEGPRWVYYVLKYMNTDPEIRVCTGSEHLDTVQAAPVVSLPEGSWGEGGFHYIWFNDGNRWTWSYVYAAEQKMVNAVKNLSYRADANIQRLLRQMGRELLLLESSDWQFLISTQAAADYAERRLLGHAHAFDRLHEFLERLASGDALSDEEWLVVEDIESQDRVFPKIDPNWWIPENQPVAVP